MKANNTKKSKKESNYILHTSVSEFSILMLSLILNNKTYGMADYRVLYENDVSLWYLTKKGSRQAYQLGKKLLDGSFFNKIIIDSEKLNNTLRSYNVPNLNANNVVSEWKKYLEPFDEFCRLYRFCEQPFQQALEEIVLKYISEEELMEFLSDSNNKTININSKAKEVLDKLLELGEIKLKLHLGAEKFFTTEWMKFVNFVAKKNYVSTQIAESLRADEFVRAMSGNTIDVVMAKKRLSGSALAKKEGKWYLESGARYLYWKNRIKKTQSEEIIGKVAFPGIVRGRVVLHQSWTGTTVIEDGDILVTGMTNPQMIPYIKKAGAIVTDEGGITCHAAIISREMKKPCITGTKNATQLLKNGDFVEVDANNGVVKIIKSAQ